MRKGWFERAIIAFADAGTLFGMPPASVELMVLEQREREQLERDRQTARDAGRDDDDDDGDGGSRVERVPVAA